MLKKIALLLFFMGLSRFAIASINGIYTGRDLLNSCNDAVYNWNTSNAVGFNTGECFGYLSGINDYIVINAVILPKQNKMPYCVPSNLSDMQIASIVVKYLNNNSQSQRLPAVVEVVSALRQTYPCKI